MDVHTVRLKLAIICTLGLAAFFGWFVLQRLWYAWRTRPMPSIETVTPRIFPDGVIGLLTIALAWFGLAGLSTLNELADFRSVHLPMVLCEIEVSASGPQGLSLLVYDQIDPEVRELARTRGVLQAPDGFVVEVQRVRFGPLLWLLGQPELVRVSAVRRIGTDGQVVRPAKGRRVGEQGSELLLAPHIRSGLFRWPFLRDVTVVDIEPTATDAKVHALLVDDGRVELRPVG